MKFAFWRREVVCQQWVELVTAYLEDSLPRRDRAAIDRHLAECEHCAEYLAQMRRTIEVTGRLRHDEVPEEIVVVLMRALAGGEEH
jgi:anti-sigma factor RsiW